MTSMTGLVYSKHALQRMQQRSISPQEVETCLRNYDTQFPGRRGNLIYRARISNGRGIKVIVDGTDEQKVITVADY